MNVKVSRSALENALRMLLQEAPAPPDPAPNASGSPTTSSPPPGPADPLASSTPEPEPAKPQEPEKTLEQKFDEKVKSLESAPEGQTLAVGNVKFVKRGGKWEISSSGDKGAIDKETLLGIVSDAAQEDVLKKIAADDKAKGTLGVTVRGDQFIETTEKAANFVKDDKGYYRDITPVPVQILAQYAFQTETGEDTGAVRASLARSAGEAQLVYRTDKLMYVIDPGKGDIYILSISDNVDNPLQATSNLLDQLDKEGRIASTGSALKGFKRKTNTEQLLTSLQNIRKFIKPAGDGTPFDVRIRDFQFIGDLQKALSARRTLFSKFVDLFQADELEMSFVYSQWGPAFKRARVLGSRGLAGGAGALSGADMDALKATGLFTEETLPSSVGGKYTPDFRQELIDEPGRSEKIGPVTVRKSGAVTGAEVTGIDTLGNALTSDYGDFYEPAYADAYFLFSNGALRFEAPPSAAPEPAVAEPPAPAPAPFKAFDDMLNKPLGGAGGGAAYFVFDKSEIAEVDPDNYFVSINEMLKDLISKVPADRVNEIKQKYQVTILVTADPVGDINYNEGLAQERGKTFYDRLIMVTKNLNYDLSAIDMKIVAVGELPWKDNEATYSAKNDNQRKALRFAKAYLTSTNLNDDTAIALAKSFGESKLGTLEETVDLKIRQLIRGML